MAKKKVPAKVEPAISSLPLPQSDTPLVIDLPDGQKLVVGKMQTGTVIEVATWRGTGRPDSRTNRMMLGVSVAGQTPAQSAEQSNSTAPAKPQNFIDLVLSLLNSLIKKAKTFQFPKLANKKNSNKVETAKEVSSATPVTSLNSEFDVDAWLNKIQEKSAAKVARETEKTASNAKSAKVTGNKGSHKSKSSQGKR